MDKSRNIYWIEVIRTLAMMLVICVHIGLAMLPKVNFNYAIMFFVVIGFSAVPSFLVISGYLLGYRFYSKKGAIYLSKFLKEKWSTIIVPYLIWNIVYLIIFIFENNISLNLWNVLIFVFTGYYTPLYYVFALIQLLIIYRLLSKYIVEKVNLILLISFLISFGLYVFSEITLWTRAATSLEFEWVTITTAFPWLFYFFWGFKLGNNKDFFQKIVSLKYLHGFFLLISYCIYFYQFKHQYSCIDSSIPRQYLLISGFVFQFFTSNFIFSILHKMKFEDDNYFVKTGKETFAIYLMHYLIVIFLFKKTWNINIYMQAAIFWLIIWFVSQLVVRNLARFKINKYFFGGR